MKYTKPVDIWALSTVEIQQLQPGQWVSAGASTTRGQFLGLRASNSVVVAWYENASQRRSYHKYIRALRDYALGI
jgi:hypothetical protein